MAISDLKQKLESLGTNKIKFAVTDIDGILRGKVISTEKFDKVITDQIAFCNVVFGWDMNDKVYDNTEISGGHTGYHDSLVTIDPDTFRTIPWDQNCPMFLGDFSESGDLTSQACPRSLLKKVANEARDMGFIPKFANEFEWFNFRETPASLREKDYLNPEPLSPGMFGYSILRSSLNSSFFSDLFEMLYDFDIPLEGLHTETGPGVYEAAIAYTDIMEAADRAVLFKTAVKEIAYRHEIMASFMAKWNSNYPGCSGHVHQSLWEEKTGRNLFYKKTGDQNLNSLMEHYIAGQLYCMPCIMPLYAPTINSYKRFVPGSWAATSVSWGIDNRTTALRVIKTDSKSAARVETRVPGSDTNPYLTMAACLASGLYGIKHKLKPRIPPTTGNEYENTNNQRLPQTLKEAVEAMKNSTIGVELFGKTFCEHFIKTREWEWRQMESNTQNWEHKRYFEII